MRPCAERDADVVIDDKPYRLDRLRELRAVEQRLKGLAGVQWPARGATQMRLKAEDERYKES